MRDPWEELEREMGYLNQNQSHQSDFDDSVNIQNNSERMLSDSLIPQVGDTLCERNAQLDRTETDPTENEELKESSVEENEENKDCLETPLEENDLA